MNPNTAVDRRVTRYLTDLDYSDVVHLMQNKKDPSGGRIWIRVLDPFYPYRTSDLRPMISLSRGFVCVPVTAAAPPSLYPQTLIRSDLGFLYKPAAKEFPYDGLFIVRVTMKTIRNAQGFEWTRLMQNTPHLRGMDWPMELFTNQKQFLFFLRLRQDVWSLHARTSREIWPTLAAQTTLQELKGKL